MVHVHIAHQENNHPRYANKSVHLLYLNFSIKKTLNHRQNINGAPTSNRRCRTSCYFCHFSFLQMNSSQFTLMLCTSLFFFSSFLCASSVVSAVHNQLTHTLAPLAGCCLSLEGYIFMLIQPSLYGYVGALWHFVASLCGTSFSLAIFLNL